MRLGEATQCTGIIKYINDADLMMIVTNIGAYHVQLVREFIVNFPEITNPDST